MLQKHINELQRDLDGLMAHESTLYALADALVGAFRAGHKLLTCGNGGSSAEAAQFG